MQAGGGREHREGDTWSSLLGDHCCPVTPRHPLTPPHRSTHSVLHSDCTPAGPHTFLCAAEPPAHCLHYALGPSSLPRPPSSLQLPRWTHLPLSSFWLLAQGRA